MVQIKQKIEVFDCDKEIASFYNSRKTVEEIRKIFPSIIIKENIDKSGLAKIVFNDKQKLQFLETLLHKKLRKEQSSWLRKKIREKKK